MQTTNLELVIKNASPAVGDFRCSLPASGTVGDLKRHLHEAYAPAHPKPECQRLIFAGRLLSDDAATLASTLVSSVQATGPYFIHVVLKPPQQQDTPAAYPQYANPMAPPPGAYPPFYYNYQRNFGAQPYAAPPPQFAAQYAAAPPPQFAAQYAAAPPPQAPAQPPQQQQRRVDVGLLFRLGFILLMFNSGGMSARTWVMIVVAVVLYLYQSGVMRAQRVPPAAPPANAQTQPRAGEAVEQQGEPARPGAVTVVGQAAAQFFLSLLPGWEPQGPLRAAPAVPRPPPAPAPAAAQAQ
eukprot:TRINITY_DN579_c0_g1_i1.p1 TRINITY_DN579_c0_g1~~TRINITY_DN579_c0_g1_i1.p1  ORF type:complete len:317 (+),score=72.43 TRINITY_DN579_c0_g1_i1:66-953(+)